MHVAIIPVSTIDKTYYQWSVSGNDSIGVWITISGDALSEAKAIEDIRESCSRHGVIMNHGWENRLGKAANPAC